MEQGLAAMRYGTGAGNTITSSYGGVLPPVKKPDEVKKNAVVKKPPIKSYSGIRG
jgi:hypothetical protein